MSIKKVAKAIQRGADRMLEQALALHRAGRLNEALAVYRDILRKVPAHGQTLKLAATLAAQQGHQDEAQGYFERLIAKAPPDPTVVCNYAVLLSTLGRFDAAISQFDRALALKSDYLAAHYNRAVVLQKMGRHAEAIPGYDRAIAMSAGDAQLHNNRGAALQMSGRHEEALASYARSLALNPRYADAIVNKGKTLRDLGRHDEALACFDAAFAMAPDNIDAQFDRALGRLLLGNFAEGLPQFEARWAADPVFNPRRNFPQPLWRGEALDGRTILLHAEQGSGDTIQMSRYAPIAAARGGRVILEVGAPLLGLLSQLTRVPGIAAVVERGAALPAFDVHCPMMGLPLACQTRLRSIPAVPALAADPARAGVWRERLEPSSGARIGLVWAGAAHHLNDRNRSIGLEKLAPLIAENPTFTFVSLQKECSVADHARLAAYPNVHQFGAEALPDFAETAALIECIDLVISVDTSVAHLAGTLGKRTWMMLPFAPDWRWLLNRSDSPWYPTLTLFRQPAPADWDAVIVAVQRELGTLKA